MGCHGAFSLAFSATHKDVDAEQKYRNRRQEYRHGTDAALNAPDLRLHALFARSNFSILLGVDVGLEHVQSSVFYLFEVARHDLLGLGV